MLAAGVSALTGVPLGVVASGTAAGGVAIEHETVAEALTSGGIAGHCTPASQSAQTHDGDG